ncbi:MAG: 3-isopropylmalate dehydratase small subunit [Candidatus Omnitrophota bacterium]|nr:MAG: 3-isopropylmalate dehydratase small subunit [Candidatus Omnitrophota bacterium]
MVIKGKVHKFGDNINTDDIIAAKYLDSCDEEFLGAKCMENVDPDFRKKIKKGDIIVAGKNFGCGSSREHAPLSIKGAGISLVIAKSFARIFYRNSINLGLPILVCEDASKIGKADVLEVDLKNGLIKDLTKHKIFSSEKFPLFMQDIIRKKGLIRWIKTRAEKEKNERV